MNIILFGILILFVFGIPPAFAELPVDEDLTQLARLWCVESPSHPKLIEFLGIIEQIDPKYHDTIFQEKFAEELLMRTPELVGYSQISTFFITQKGEAEHSCPPTISFEGSFQTNNGKLYEFDIRHEKAQSYDYNLREMVFPSPLKQLQFGTNYNDIKCNDHKVLILKYGRTFPACVNPETVPKLFERSWALNEVPIIDIKTEELESKRIQVMGVINRFDTIEGFEYKFIPIQKEIPSIAHTGYKTVNLFATNSTVHQFIRDLDGSLVKVSGSLLLDNGEYRRHFSGYPILPVEKLEVISKNEHLDYSIYGAQLISITKISDDNILNIVLEESQGGSFKISIPRKLIDAKIGEKTDDLFFVLIDSIEVPYTEVIDENTRTLTISFGKGARIIEIIGTNWT